MSTKLFDLSGRVALITGASRGIGEATARLLAEQGAHVIVSSRKQEDLDKVAAAIAAAGGKATAIAAHQGESAALKNLMAEIAEKFGRLDILVNNAATNPYFGHISDTDAGMVDKTLQDPAQELTFDKFKRPVAESTSPRCSQNISSCRR